MTPDELRTLPDGSLSRDEVNALLDERDQAIAWTKALEIRIDSWRADNARLRAALEGLDLWATDLPEEGMVEVTLDGWDNFRAVLSAARAALEERP